MKRAAKTPPYRLLAAAPLRLAIGDRGPEGGAHCEGAEAPG
ncbi:hypothetical protein [Methylocystis sp. S23]|jgi:hypothetical protein